ncbi:MAG: ATP-binding protein [DPANN group archaeon]|nr:ATP-binding protein [DPANN group archaeon]
MVYEIIAGRSPKDKERLGLAGTIFLGKHYVQMERIQALSNPVYLDVSGPHVVLISGKRGTGKSYTISTITEGLTDLPEDIKNNLSFLIFDTMGIFWTMKYPNYKDDKILKEWGLTPKGLRPVIFVPFGLFDSYQEKGVPCDLPFSLKPSELSAEDWSEIFEIDLLSGAGILLERAVTKAKENLGIFEINELINVIETDKEAEKQEKQILKNKLTIANGWGIFKAAGTEILDLFKSGTTTILDLSAYAQAENGERLKALVIGLVSKKILEQRMASRKAEEVKLISEGGFLFGEQAAIAEKESPLVWIIIDEAHEFLPRTGKTLASNALIQILREGRQPGISLVLATQQPGKIHTDVITQADIVLSHKVTSKIDLSALNEIAATYLTYDIQRYIDDLPVEKGAAVLIDDKLEKIYPMQVRPKYSWHGGEDPTAIKGELKQFGLTV